MLSPAPPSPLVCPPRVPTSPQIQSTLFHRYSSSQTFFYSNLISELVSQKCTPAALHHEDLGCWTDEQQFLKRQYGAQEYERKMQAFREYYYYHEDCPRLFGGLDLARVYERWHQKRRDLVYKKLKIMFDETYSTLGSSDRSHMDEDYAAEPVCNFLMDISEYNPYSKNYYLRVRAREDKNRADQAQKQKQMQDQSHDETANCGRLKQQLSYMVNNISCEVSSLMLSMMSSRYGQQYQQKGDSSRILNDVSIRFDTYYGKGEMQAGTHYEKFNFSKNKENKAKELKSISPTKFMNEEKATSTAQRKSKIEKLKQIKIHRNQNNRKSEPKLKTSTKITTLAGLRNTHESTQLRNTSNPHPSNTFKKVSSSINLITVKGFNKGEQIRILNNKVGLIKFGSVNQRCSNQIINYSPKKSLKELKVTKLDPLTQNKHKNNNILPLHLQRTNKLIYTTNLQLKRPAQLSKMGAELKGVQHARVTSITKQFTQQIVNTQQFTDRKIAPSLMASYQSQRLLPSYSQSNLRAGQIKAITNSKEETLLKNKLLGVRLNPEKLFKNQTLHQQGNKGKSVKISLRAPGRQTLIFNNKLK